MQEIIMEWENGELLQRLESCKAVHSLDVEQELATLLRQLGWSVAHGSYLPNPNTGECRELDVLASNCWRKGSLAHPQTIELMLPIEVKSTRDFHIVFAPLAEAKCDDWLDNEAVGFHGKRFIETLERGGANEADVLSTFDWFENTCATGKGSLLASGSLLHPPQASFRSSSFRETNIGGEKEPGKDSVLWKAMQSVFGAVESSKRQKLDRVFNVVADSVSFARRINRTVSEVVETEFFGMGVAGRLYLYHPIVFVESHLWSRVAGSLQPQQWCRFYRIGSTGDELWCDVVSVSAAASYLKELSDCYATQVRELGASVFPGTSSDCTSRFGEVVSMILSVDASDPRLPPELD
jgi:hypothetical protein